MRADARNLLDRLGRGDFAYREFADRFSDLELWPLFEALLKDPRVFQQETVAEAVDPRPAEPVSAPGIAAARPAGSGDRGGSLAVGESLADLFNRYEAGASAPQQVRQGQDVRAMLRRLSDLDERGEL
ncbi:hypothetical protein [Novosphingobium sp. 9U]|uniref:hypothetical protein n=1 Tax=Novosphingobium sp. 9U TaxID=2653158 RepID=UPI0012F1AE7C|nr:hypothetical protein [Novosphingobium sp. 9U]VWX53631.1 hypothetical protein NOVOSPHI9U_50263 [Novosphingobium sp. 9U]